MLDARTGATNPVPEMLRWRLHLTYSDPDVFAEKLTPGQTYPTTTNIAQMSFITPGQLFTNQVHYFYVPTCPATTRAIITLVGLSNVNQLELLMDRDGLPTGEPETDDYGIFLNFDNPPNRTGTNGIARIVLTTNSPASAPLIPGKNLYFAVRNRFINETNEYTFRVDLDGVPCLTPSQPVRLSNSQSIFSSLSAGSSSTEGELYIHQVNSLGEPLTIEASSEGNLQILVSRGVEPTRESFTYSVNATSSGTERLVISATSNPALETGTYYIRILNNSDYPVTYTVSASSAPGFAIHSDAQFVNGRFTLSFDSALGEQYEIQSSSDLLTWNMVTTLTASGSETTYEAPASEANAPARFYRVVAR
jgi:hypothetical protein